MVKIHRDRPQRGFTLIELLVAALVGAILLAATAGIVVQILRIDREETARIEVQAELIQGLEFIQNELSEALYIYNDAVDGTGAIIRDSVTNEVIGDDIPDLLQVLYNNQWIAQPEDSVPVVAFWKFDPIPDDCFAGNFLKDPAPTGISQQDWSNINQRRNVYVLVVYYLRRNYNNAGNPAEATEWEGNARIIRYQLNPFIDDDNSSPPDDDCLSRNPSFIEDPDPFIDGFLAWPPTGQTTVSNPNSVVLISNIYSSRQERSLAVRNEPTAICEPGYTLAGAKPGAAFNGTFSGLNENDADQGFYICVRRSAGAGAPQDAVINLIGTSLDRANVGLFGRYIDDASVLSEQQISGYLHPLEARVLARGVINRTL